MYVNYRCRGPAFPLNCTDSVARLDGSEENRQSEIINVEVYTCTPHVLLPVTVSRSVLLCCMHVYYMYVSELFV
jgi:hypothetical protein